MDTSIFQCTSACSKQVIVSDMINHNTVVNDHSSSDPTFAVSNDTNNDMHMQTYVMANGASTEPESLAEAKVTIDKGILASAITRFPMEVIERIIKWSVTPKGGKFKMPGLTMAEYKPGVNINVLLVNRAFYHEGRKCLLNNIFIIGDYGSDLQKLVTSTSLTRCRLDGCITNLPIFRSVLLDIGDTWAGMNFAEAKVHAFACTLKYLREPLRVKVLFINFRQACFLSPNAHAQTVLRWFSDCLVNIQVSQFFILQGLDLHLYLDVRRFAEKLGMNCQPITSTFHPRYFVELDNGDVEIAEGRYANIYVPATAPNQVYRQPGQIIEDATSQFLEYKDTEEGMDFYP